MQQPEKTCTFNGSHMQGLSDARVSLIGDIEAVQEQELASVKQAYKQQHPNSFWVDFGDFSMWKLSPRLGRLIGGFARAGSVCLQRYHLLTYCPAMPAWLMS